MVAQTLVISAGIKEIFLFSNLLILCNLIRSKALFAERNWGGGIDRAGRDPCLCVFMDQGNM